MGQVSHLSTHHLTIASGLGSSLIDVKSDDSGAVYVLGKFRGTNFTIGTGSTGAVRFSSPDTWSFFVAKYSSAGALIWAFPLSCQNTQQNSLTLLDLEVSDSGFVYVTGAIGLYPTELDFFNSAQSPSTLVSSNHSFGSDQPLWAQYTAAQGHYVNHQIIRSSPVNSVSDSVGKVEKAALDSAGNLVMAGRFISISGQPLLLGGACQLSSSQGTHFLTKYDSNGNCLFAEAFTLALMGQVNSLALDNQDFIYLAGRFSNPADFDPDPNAIVPAVTFSSLNEGFALRLNPNGRTPQNIIRPFIAIGDSEINEILPGDNGTFYISGYGSSLYSLPQTVTSSITYSSSLFMAKYSGLNQHWSYSIPYNQLNMGVVSNTNISDMRFANMALDQCGNLYVTGWNQETATLVYQNSFPTSVILNNLGTAYDHFLLQLNSSSGGVNWVGQEGPQMSGYANNHDLLFIDQTRNYLIYGGSFRGTPDLNPSASVLANMTAVGSIGDAFYTKASYSCSNNALSVEKLTLYISHTDEVVELAWIDEGIKESETRYKLERSHNGQNFETLKEELSETRYEDEEPLWGQRAYYRVRKTDQDGQQVFSNVVEIELAGNLELTLYPNPNSGEKISYKLKKPITGRVKIVTLEGKKILQQEVTEKSGTFEFSPRLTPGNYLLLLTSEEENLTKKFIVQ